MSTKNQLRITLFQSNLHWEDKDANLAMFEEKLRSAAEDQPDVFILPEMFSTGFSMNAPMLAEKMNGRSVEWMAMQATRYQAIVTGSLIIEEEGHYYNRLIWMQPDGNYRYYDKRHLFGMAREQEHYSAGSQKLIVEWQGWRICPLICYDLRFPVWNRNREDYDIALYVANWPQRRSLHWKSLLLARAIENQAFVMGVNRVGTDGKGLYYSGDSCVIAPNGEYLFQQADSECHFSIDLQKEVLEQTRQQLPFLKDRDEDWEWV